MGAFGIAAWAYSAVNVDGIPALAPDGSRVALSEVKLPDKHLPAFAPALHALAPAAPEYLLGVPSGKVGSYFDYQVADDHVNFYAFKLAGVGGLAHRGLMHATSDAPAERKLISEWPHLDDRNWDSGEYIISAATMVGDEMWAYVCESWINGMCYAPVGVFKINPESGRAENTPLCDDFEVYDYNNHISEMSYDPSTGYLWGMRNKAGGWCGLEVELERTIMRLDVQNPAAGWEEVGTIDHAFAMAADEGYLYFVQGIFGNTTDSEGNQVIDIIGCSLYKINAEDYAAFEQTDLEKVGDINHGFLKINYLQSMEFDHSDHTLWWHGAKYDNSGTPFMTRLDTETAETDDPLLTTDGAISLVALCIPYEYCQDKAVPHYVRNLSVTVVSEGASEATFSWTNPSMSSDRKELEGLTSIRVYRDDTLYETITDIQPGAQCTWTDNGQESGMHSYRFVPVNSHGEGLSRQRNIFVGHDVPNAPSDIRIDTDGNKAEIAWSAPTTGINNGWIDQTTLKYDVTRLPDNKKVATGIDATSCTDDASKYMGYSYVITASTADGKGGAATSQIAPFGPPVDVPYLNELLSENDANMFTIIDGNRDGYKFEYDITPCEIGVRSLWIGSASTTADDWVILPALNFGADKKYKMFVTYAVSNYANKIEKFELRQGAKNTIEAQTTILDTWEVETKYGEYEQQMVIVPDASKGNFLSIRLASEPDQGWVVIRRVEVREYSAKDASLVDFDGPSVAFTEGVNTYQVTVKNEGNAAMRGAKAQLISYPQGEVLAQATVGATKVGETNTVNVDWQPSQAGTVNVTARVVLDGDTYEEDNVTDRYLTVDVREGAPQEWKSVLAMDNVGYGPFYTMLGYNEVETIYLKEEVGLQDITITGICYEYKGADGYEKALTTIPVEIWAATTDRENLSRYVEEKGDYYGDKLPENIFSKCYSGIVDMAGRQEKNNITLMFDEPFYYAGTDNLVIRNINANESATKMNNYWHITFEIEKELKDLRSTRYNPSDGQLYKLNIQVPAIKIAYLHGNHAGNPDAVADGFITIGAGAYVSGRDICFEARQDLVEIFDIKGAKVASAINTDKVTALAPGTYIATGHIGNNITSKKLIVK